MALELTTPENRESVQSFIEKVQKTDRIKRTAEDFEKEGVFTGSYCLNPVTGRRMPVYLANFVLMDYGTGAVMAVPTHDQRDFEFARKYGLPLQVVIQPPGEVLDPATMTGAWEEAGTMVNSGPFDGLDNDSGKLRITEHLEQLGCGRRTVNYRLRDWLVSRQRYWGTPIPVVYCAECGTVPVPEEQLPVVLPTDVVFTGEGGSPLAKLESFVNTSCPRCGSPARRETDTFDTFVESSWYFLRYASPQHDSGPVERSDVDYWLPVDHDDHEAEEAIDDGGNAREQLHGGL